MIVFPNCKINLGLDILGKRPDGYHNLETVFYPLPLYDVLEVFQPTAIEKEYELQISGIEIEGKPETNLCVKAYQLLKKDFPQLPNIKICLHKAIPAGAGLGGGSADGAFMLTLLNEKFNLDIQQKKLLEYALALGSDSPFFIINTPCFAQQRGEILEPLNISLSGYNLVLINPGIHINTGWAFSQVQFSTNHNIKSIIQQPVETWKNNLTNSFEAPIFVKHAELKTIKETLYNNGAIYASMSGSGSSLFGIFNTQTNIDKNLFPAHYFIRQLLL